MSITYKEAGVDIDAGDALVERIKPHARRTMRPEVLAGIGGFGALVEISKKFREPVLVAGTDGVGTKLKLAFELNRHDTVGIDLVLLLLTGWLVYSLAPILTPFLAGALLAYMFNPLASRFQRFGLSRAMATLAVISLVTMIYYNWSLFLMFVGLMLAGYAYYTTTAKRRAAVDEDVLEAVTEGAVNNASKRS